MDNQLSEIGAKLGKGVLYTIRWCFRSVWYHRFLVVFLWFLLFLYRSFPLIFSLLISASPVLVCTAVLLGILLSYGQPSIPEIEMQQRRTDEIVVEKTDRFHVGEFGEDRRGDSEGAEYERSREVQFQLSVGELKPVDRDLGNCGDHSALIVEKDEEKGEASSGDDESFGSEKVNVDSLDSPPQTPWTRAGGVQEEKEEEEEDDDDDDDSDRAESSSPDASMAEIMPMLDELHPLLDEAAPQLLQVSSDDSSDAVSERSSSHESDDGSGSQKGLDTSDNENGDERLDGEEGEEGVKSAITWTEEDQKNLMELRSSEIERNQRLENLIMTRTHGRNLDEKIENGDDVEDGDDDEEDEVEDKEEEQTESPIAWTEEDQRNVMELRSSEIERNQRLENIIMRRARNRELDNDNENIDDVDGEEEEDGPEDKEEEAKSPITWTEEDQKNVMDLGWSEIERNQRLENLILRRRARKSMGMLPERNLAGMESYDLPFNVAPISTRRRNPFDDLYDDSGLPPIPGSAPSILLPRRNPFDIPYDSSEEKPDLLGGEFQEEVKEAAQPREPFFRKYESFNVRSSRFARQEKEVTMRPYFVPEQTFQEESSYSQFQRQLSEVSESKVSSVPETDSVSSFEDLANRNLPEEDIEIIEECRHQEPEPELTIAEHARDGSESSSSEPEPESMHARDGSESSSSEDLIELGQVENRDGEVIDAHSQPQNVVEDTVAVEQIYASDSSSSSHSEVSERILSKTGSPGLLMPEEMRNEFTGISPQASAEYTALTTTSTLVNETPYRAPVYDSSPREVKENSLLSSSSSNSGHPGTMQEIETKTLDESPVARDLDTGTLPGEARLNVPDIPSKTSSSVTPDVFNPITSHENAQKIVEEVDEIKEIHGLLSELDRIGDFGNSQWGSSSNEVEQHQVPARKTSTEHVIEVSAVEGDKIQVENASTDRESPQVEVLSKETGVTNIGDDSVAEKASLAFVRTETSIGDESAFSLLNQSLAVDKVKNPKPSLEDNTVGTKAGSLKIAEAANDAESSQNSPASTKGKGNLSKTSRTSSSSSSSSSSSDSDKE